MLCIKELYRDDIAPIASFLSEQTGSPPHVVQERLSWLAENPAHRPDIPLAIAAYQEEHLVGTMVLIPHRFSNGSAVQTCILSALFYVDKRVRGTGLLLFLKFRALNAKYPLYCATANAASAPLWQSFSGIPIEGSDREFVRACRWTPIVKAFLRIGESRKTEDNEHPLVMTTAKAALIPLQVSELAGAETSAIRSSDFEVLRDPALLCWKVYSREQKVYRFEGKASRCFCVFQHDLRGRNRRLASTEIVDLWGRLTDADWTSFVSAIKNTFSPDFITFRGCSPVAKLGFSQRGFFARKLKTFAAWLIDPNQLLGGRFVYNPLAGE
jgi:GNAT superfamily N-acetyltransferase